MFAQKIATTQQHFATSENSNNQQTES